MPKRSEEELIKTERKFFDSLSEKDKRRYTAVEALKKGIHGITEISEKFRIDQKTIRSGIEELENEEMPEVRIRKRGGGRKKN